MPRIVSVGTAVPEHRVRREDAQALTRQLFDGAVENLDTLLPLFDHAQVQTRYSSAPREWFAQTHLFPERNRLYVESALDLAARRVPAEDHHTSKERFYLHVSAFSDQRSRQHAAVSIRTGPARA